MFIQDGIELGPVTSSVWKHGYLAVLDLQSTFVLDTRQHSCLHILRHKLTLLMVY